MVYLDQSPQHNLMTPLALPTMRQQPTPAGASPQLYTAATSRSSYMYYNGYSDSPVDTARHSQPLAAPTTNILESLFAQSPQTQSMSKGGAQYTLIANVPYDTVRQDLVVEFRKYGRVELAMVVCDEASRHPHKEWTSTAGYAFVRFSQRSEAAAAIQAASMGLITIRGTRVRADWARKDSYAKRGRVSPAQGAPLLGPLGMPDGIEQMHYSLMERRKQTAAWGGVEGAAAATAALGGEEEVGGEQSSGFAQALTPPKTTSPMEATAAAGTNEGRTNLEILQALHEAFSQMLATRTPPTDQVINDGLQTAPTTPLLNYHDENVLFGHLTRSSSSTASDNGPNNNNSNDGSSTTTTPTKSPNLLLPPEAAKKELASPIKYDDVLSPCSRGLLEQALSDVVGGDHHPPPPPPVVSEAVQQESALDER